MEEKKDVAAPSLIALLSQHPFLTNALDKSTIAEFLESVFKFAELERASGARVAWSDVLAATREPPSVQDPLDYNVTLQVRGEKNRATERRVLMLTIRLHLSRLLHFRN